MSSVVIDMSSLSLGYGGKPVILDATASIEAKDFVFIVGKSGSGKSTLLKSFYGEVESVSGSLSVCGVNMKNIVASKLNILRRHIGIVFQDYRLINEWTIEKNVMLPLIVNGFAKTICINQAQKLLKHVKLLHKAGKYPLELSGGEQQRVAMARALAHNPVLILADEPTGNLDDYSSEVIWNLLRSAKEFLGTTVIVVTHHIPSTINVNYKHFFIDDGYLHEII
ncbi:MAG: ABC transporter ATP-binding protein [Campylobacteraceae bacterium]|jgi:cell division transport system ATP-binding protein|nr:ABC transporter ATP-binding protein [Campylobacteraceae bacterium]